MMNIITRIGIDLAKNTFSVCGVDRYDKIVLERTLKRKELLPFLASLQTCIIVMELSGQACCLLGPSCAVFCTAI